MEGEKKMKKFVALILALALMCCFASSAFAITGTVSLSDPDSFLFMRNAPSTSASVRAYLRHNTTVTLLDGASQTNGFYHVTGWSYTSRTDLTTGADRTGYASAAYII